MITYGVALPIAAVVGALAVGGYVIAKEVVKDLGQTLFDYWGGPYEEYLATEEQKKFWYEYPEFRTDTLEKLRDPGHRTSAFILWVLNEDHPNLTEQQKKWLLLHSLWVARYSNGELRSDYQNNDRLVTKAVLRLGKGIVNDPQWYPTDTGIGHPTIRENNSRYATGSITRFITKGEIGSLWHEIEDEQESYLAVHGREGALLIKLGYPDSYKYAVLRFQRQWNAIVRYFYDLNTGVGTVISEDNDWGPETKWAAETAWNLSGGDEARNDEDNRNKWMDLLAESQGYLT